MGAVILNNVRIRRLEPTDLPAALRFTQEQGWSHRLEDWEFHVRLAHAWAACDESGELVGTAAWWAWGEQIATIGFVLVRKDRQGRGIGARLMDVVLEDAGKRTLRLVATKAGVGTYRRLGFVETGAILQCQGSLAAAAASPPPPGVSLRSVTAEDLELLCELDAQAFGAPRTALIRAIHETGRGGLVAARGDTPVGFALQRLSGRGLLIGPVVADEEPVATALVSRLLSEGSGFVRIDIPADAEALAALLGAAGLPAIDRYPCMVRDAQPPRRAGVRTFGLASQALG